MKTKLGKVKAAYNTEKFLNAVQATIYVRARSENHEYAYLEFSCQANDDSPNYYYALKQVAALEVNGPSTNFTLELLHKIIKLYTKEQCPVAYCIDGKPYIGQDSLRRLIRSLDKLGTSCPLKDTRADAFEFSYNL